MLTVGSLFSGIGGLDLGLERAGMRVIWQSEIDSYACKVLAKHWPEVPNHGNIKEINWEEVERPDVICGGYPCQPFSTAGKRRGEEDPRHLWPWVRDAIGALRPRYAILENVRGHLSLGGTTVVGELAELGYDCEWRVVSAASVGANHRRDRIIIVAYPNDTRPHRAEIDATEAGEPSQRGLGRRGAYVANASIEQCDEQFGRGLVASGGEQWVQGQVGGSGSNVADTDSSDTPNGRQCASVSSEDRSRGDDRSGSGGNLGEVCVGSTRGNPCCVSDTDGAGSRGIGSLSNGRKIVFGTKNQLQGKNGFTGWTWWQIEPDVGRVADGVPSRVDRLRGLGNAVVPQVAEVIGKLVMAHAGY